ncbi:MAG: helicase-exonuclease AddAB subunit AddB [Desulfitobacteriaceae bacterium]|nr:helicase-exonuclease AddAB subunit AddB [Desulfitobacteriaceae bacterium]
MSLRFILGRAGSGKTHKCHEEIRQRLLQDPQGKPILFIVPEQATFLTEKFLAESPGLMGSIRAQVLSFRRLAWRVLQEVGGGARQHIGELGKQMVLRKILDENKERLQAFQKSIEQPGFMDCLSQALCELKKYRITSRQLEETAVELIRGEGEGLLVKKLHDLGIIHEEFELFLGDKYIDPEDYLTKLAESLGRSQTVSDAEVWMDGFAGFTPQEMLVVEKLFLTCRQVNVALCLDPKALENDMETEDLFFPLWDTYQKIKALAEDSGVEIVPPLILDGEPLPRFQEAPLLGHIEKKFDSSRTVSWTGNTDALKLMAAANKRAEVEAAAREIMELCREEGYRWRDISVVVRDLSLYRDLISVVFRDYGIPCFVDVKRSVLHHPLIELIRSALEVVSDNWVYDPVFRYLKTDLIPVTREEIDYLENYVLAHGIRGSRWYDKKPWTYRRRFTMGEDSGPLPWEEEELARVNQIKEKACGHLAKFYRKINQAETVKELSTDIFDLLTDLDVFGQLEDWRERAENLGQLDIALEYAQVWDAVMDLLDQIVEAMGEQKMSLVNYAKVLDAGINAIRLGLIPPSLDQVFVAGLDRSRNPNVKACFVLGVNDGVLPARVQDEGVFSSHDREMLAQHHEMAPGSRKRLMDEKFLSYIALTRAGKRMWVSFALADEEGRSLKPSYLIRRLKENIPGIEEMVCPMEPSGKSCRDLEFVSDIDHGLSFLGLQLRNAKSGKEINELWWDVYNYAAKEPNLYPKLQQLTKGLFYSNQEKFADRQVAGQLFGKKLRTSVSRLEKFSACPFAHFVSYGLRLKERDEYRLGAPDLGQLFHAALQKITDDLAAQGINWANLTNEDCSRLAKETVLELAPKLQNEILLSTARYRYLIRKLSGTITTTLAVLAEHGKRGEFRPVRWEINFGPDGPLSSLKFDLGDGREMELVGRVDRIDAASDGSNYYLRVIDYKSGKSSWDLTDLFYGLKMQLMVYLLVSLSNSALLVGEDALPAGMLYFGVHNPFISADAPLEEEKAKEEVLKSLKMKGVVIADPQIVNLMDREARRFSPLVPVALRADGTVDQRYGGVSFTQFNLLKEHFLKHLRQASCQILDGFTAISPYKKGNFSACRYCDFKPVCHFDPLMADNKFRPLVKPDDLWAELKSRVGEDKDE